jgi:hypothetical protein
LDFSPLIDSCWRCRRNCWVRSSETKAQSIHHQATTDPS